MSGAPILALAGSRFYRAFQWETEERKAWEGRDWRRLKRERRKFMSNGPRTQTVNRPVNRV